MAAFWSCLIGYFMQNQVEFPYHSSGEAIRLLDRLVSTKACNAYSIHKLDYQILACGWIGFHGDHKIETGWDLVQDLTNELCNVDASGKFIVNFLWIDPALNSIQQMTDSPEVVDFIRVDKTIANQ